jgi:hypothetical protein
MIVRWMDTCTMQVDIIIIIFIMDYPALNDTNFEISCDCMSIMCRIVCCYCACVFTPTLLGVSIEHKFIGKFCLFVVFRLPTDGQRDGPCTTRSTAGHQHQLWAALQVPQQQYQVRIYSTSQFVVPSNFEILNINLRICIKALNSVFQGRF